MKIHPSGIPTIILLLFGVAALMFLLNLAFPYQSSIHFLLYAAAVTFMFFVIRFFRFPDRKITPDADAVFSVADGKVVVIEKVHVDEYFNDERLQVSVFMSVMNVHINWSPIAGEVVYKKHHHGKHLVAFNPKSSLINEHTSLVIRDSNGREVMVRQIAGAVARRIICKAEEGDKYEQGEHIGMIKFGSRIDLLLPLDAKIEVKIDDLPVGCGTVIARLK
jgi:phosphatidylserine decarboxylase